MGTTALQSLFSATAGRSQPSRGASAQPPVVNRRGGFGPHHLHLPGAAHSLRTHQAGSSGRSSRGFRCKAISPEHEQLAKELKDAEEQLQAMFEGPVPPSAGKVAQQRERVADLRDMLEASVSESLPAGSDGRLAAVGAAAAVSQAALDSVASLLTDGADDPESALQRASGGFSVEAMQLSIVERRTAEILASENAQLRFRARALLHRQQELSELLGQHLTSLHPANQYQPGSSSSSGGGDWGAGGGAGGAQPQQGQQWGGGGEATQQPWGGGGGQQQPPLMRRGSTRGSGSPQVAFRGTRPPRSAPGMTADEMLMEGGAQLGSQGGGEGDLEQTLSG